MSTKIRLAPIPAPALVHLRTLYPPLMSQESLIGQVMRVRGMADGLLRDMALKQELTLSEVVRRQVVAAHPEVEALWPPRQCTPGQLSRAVRRQKTSALVNVEHPYRAELRNAASIMGRLLSNVDSLRFRNQARAFIEEWT